jgi:hypothetical protein
MMIGDRMDIVSYGPRCPVAKMDGQILPGQIGPGFDLLDRIFEVAN